MKLLQPDKLRMLDWRVEIEGVVLCLKLVSCWLSDKSMFVVLLNLFEVDELRNPVSDECF